MPSTIAIAGTVASVGMGAASAAGAFNPSDPTGMNYGALSRDAYKAQIDLMPEMVAAKQQYDPQMSELQGKLAQQSWFGTPAGNRTETYTDYQDVPAVYSPTVVGAHGTISGGQLITPAHTVPVTKTRTVDDPGAPGLLDLMDQAGPRINKYAAQSNTSQRTADIADVANLGPSALAAMKGFDPQSTAIADKLADTALGRLQSSYYGLDPSTSRQLQQNIRASQAARGVGNGENDANAEAYYLTSTADQRQSQNLSLASQVLNQRASLYGDPMLQILGRSSGRSPNPTQYVNPYGSSVPTGVDPNAFGVAQSNFNATNAANIAGYNSQMQGIGALTGGIGKLAGSYYGMPSTGASLPAINVGSNPGGYTMPASTSYDYGYGLV